MAKGKFEFSKENDDLFSFKYFGIKTMSGKYLLQENEIKVLIEESEITEKHTKKIFKDFFKNQQNDGSIKINYFVLNSLEIGASYSIDYVNKEIGSTFTLLQNSSFYGKYPGIIFCNDKRTERQYIVKLIKHITEKCSFGIGQQERRFSIIKIIN